MAVGMLSRQHLDECRGFSARGSRRRSVVTEQAGPALLGANAVISHVSVADLQTYP